MDNEKIWHLLILKLSGEATDQELAELYDLLQQHPDMAVQAASVEGVWRSRGAETGEDTDELFNRHLQRLSDDTVENTPFFHIAEVRPRRVRRIRTLVAVTAVAACVALVVLLAYNVFQGGSVKVSAPLASGNFVSTKNGSKSKLQLPDGTQVWLNSGSNISYDNDFGGATRQVQLTGEAFFDVVKDNVRPFIIHTATVDIKVLGTAFNVRSYPEEKVTETSLIRGAVEVTLKANADKKIFLKPNEKLIVSNDSTLVKSDSIQVADVRKKPAAMTLTQVHHLNKDTVASEVLWTKNKLVFDGETLSEVALKLERWYGVKVIIQGDELKNIEYTGVFDDDNLTEVLYALQLSGNFKYVVKRNEVIIRP
ncbi:MAG TPA: FecR domain-containing protein [Puia sp.]|jgi:ferric-dicitrate binding protein FerR (iron transport regulator)|nr:FecR domain-containing protein [Puia sp.]